MFTNQSTKKQSRVIAIALLISLILSFIPGPATGASLAGSIDDPVIQGTPVTPLQIKLAEAIVQRLAAGLPAPSVEFSADAGSAENFSALSQPLAMRVLDQTTKTTANSTLHFNGPQEAGYTEWPRVEVTGNLAGGEKTFSTGDLSDLMRTIVEKQEPDFWKYATYGQEAREYTITETMEQSPGYNPPRAGMNLIDKLGLAPLDFTTDASLDTTEDILMGFTYTGPHIKYILEQKAKSCVWIPFLGDQCIEWYYVKAGFELDWALGLRLPATVNLNRSTLTDTSFNTSLIAQDWSEDQYSDTGVAAEGGNEFLLRLDFWTGVLVRIVGQEVCPIAKCYLDLSNDYSASFVTPFGTGTSFPIPDITIQMFEFSGAGVTADVNLIITPRLTSTDILADWKATKGSDCEDEGMVKYEQPGEVKTFNTALECFSSGSDPINVTLNHFRYYFNRFSLVFGAGVTIDLWGLWSGGMSADIFTLDLSAITGAIGLYVPDHVQCNWSFVCGRAGPDNSLSFTTPPAITYSIEGTAGKDGWYRSDVTLTWTVVDNGWPIDTLSGCDPLVLTGEHAQKVYTCAATSAGGEAQVDVIIGIDTSGPVITCEQTDPFILNSGDHIVVPDNIDASLSGLDGSADNVLTGTVTTQTVGPQVLTFSAFDLAGNQGEATCSYVVGYNSSGFLPPVNEWNSGQAGRTYPIKWQLTDDAGLFISALTAVVKIEAKPSSMCLDGYTATNFVRKATIQGTWRYDSEDNQFIYNWRTPNTAGCYALEVTLDSGQIMTAYFALR